MQQGRWVSYIFRYRDNVRCENAGFIKVQRIARQAGDEARIQIGLKLYKKKACKCMAYLLYKNGEAGLVNAVYLEEIPLLKEERDAIMKRVEIPWRNPQGNGRSFPDYDGILFCCEDGERLLGMWREYPVNPDEIILEKGSQKEQDERKQEEQEQEEQTLLPENMTELVRIKEKTPPVSASKEDGDVAAQEPDTGKIDAGESDIEEPDVKEINAEEPDTEKIDAVEPDAGEPDTEKIDAVEPDVDGPQAESCQEETPPVSASEEGADVAAQVPDEEDICTQMLRTHPKIPLFVDSPYLECVKIVPQDIGKLAMGNWKLGENSFLSHGYYHYRYIMMGRVRINDQEKYVIGVPGVFTNKERYLANMFGFCLFIPVKNTDYMTGSFGYWISEILRE